MSNDWTVTHPGKKSAQDKSVVALKWRHTDFKNECIHRHHRTCAACVALFLSVTIVTVQ